jgi:hypothetical protein
LLEIVLANNEQGWSHLPSILERIVPTNYESVIDVGRANLSSIGLN